MNFRKMRLRRRVWSLGLVVLLSGCAMLREATEPDFNVLDYPWPTPAPVAWRTPERSDYALPRAVEPLLVVADRWPEQPKDEMTYPRALTALLRHFTPETHWVFADKLTGEQVFAAQAVIYLGSNEHYKIPPQTIELLRDAKRLTWFGYHLEDARRSGLAFGEIVPAGTTVEATDAGTLQYAGGTFPVEGPARYVGVRTLDPASAVASIRYGAATVPLVIEDRGNYYVSSLESLRPGGSHSIGQMTMLAVADALNDAIGVPVTRDVHTAILCLDGVSAETPPRRLAALVASLYKKGTPYCIGFVPSAEVKANAPVRLKEDPYLVEVLLWAQQHGATLAMHAPRRAAAAGPVELSKVRIPIRDILEQESVVGLRPVIWETPYGDAGGADDLIASTFFGAAWQRSAPAAWLPWVVQSDAHGQVVLPAFVASVPESGAPTVAQQLDSAATLLACRGCVASAFLPVEDVSLESLEGYVDKLRAMGYVFVDPEVFARSPRSGENAYEFPASGGRVANRSIEERAP